MRLNQIATIVPVANLGVIGGHRYHMALTHLLGIPEYFEFYRKQAASGAFVMLDNSTVELGAPEAMDLYIDKAIAVGAREILTPDYLFDYRKTLDAMVDGLRDIAQAGYSGSIQVVPQGSTPEEWLHCLRVMLEFPRISTIGISKRYKKMFGDSRLFAVLAARSVMEAKGRTDVKIHLLGCEERPEVDVAPCLTLPYVRGVDSGLASVFTAAHKPLGPGLVRPKLLGNGLIDLEHEVLDNNPLVKNVAAWQQLCSYVPNARGLWNR